MIEDEWVGPVQAQLIMALLIKPLHLLMTPCESPSMTTPRKSLAVASSTASLQVKLSRTGDHLGDFNVLIHIKFLIEIDIILLVIF